MTLLFSKKFIIIISLLESWTHAQSRRGERTTHLDWSRESDGPRPKKTTFHSEGHIRRKEDLRSL